MKKEHESSTLSTCFSKTAPHKYTSNFASSSSTAFTVIIIPCNQLWNYRTKRPHFKCYFSVPLYLLLRFLIFLVFFISLPSFFKCLLLPCPFFSCLFLISAFFLTCLISQARYGFKVIYISRVNFFFL